MSDVFANPPRDCPLCPRLVAFRLENRAAEPLWWNSPVPAFGALDAKLLVVGLAPGLKGANASGRPFTGDYAGIILYGALTKVGLATGDYKALPDDGFTLVNTRVTNAVRCVPPQNKPVPEEIRTCNRFLQSEIEAMPSLRVILSLGAISHQAVIRALGKKQAAHKFGHAAEHEIKPGLTLIDSYHTSRYNINTGVLTEKMFGEVMLKVKTRALAAH